MIYCRYWQKITESLQAQRMYYYWHHVFSHRFLHAVSDHQRYDRIDCYIVTTQRLTLALAQ